MDRVDLQSRLPPQHRRYWWLAIAVVLLSVWSLRITGTPATGDGEENLRQAVDLAHHGVYSLDTTQPFTPSMAREPLPVFVTAGMIVLHDALFGPSPDEAWFAGEGGRLLKLQNVLWMGLLCAALGAAVFRLTGSMAAVVVTLLVINMPLLSGTNSRYMVDSLYTESPAAALLALGSVLLAASFPGRPIIAVVAGVAFGLLALVKALFSFVFAGLVGVLLVMGLLGWVADPAVRLLRIALLVAGFAVVVVPWMVRNQIQLDRFAIIDRGGEVLYQRATKNRMTAVEIRGTFYHWAPLELRGVMRRVLGFTREDIERGGRLQRLNRAENSSFAASDRAAEIAGRPEAAISYYRQVRAELVRLTREAEVRGQARPEQAAQQVMQQRAFAMLGEQPLRHLAMTIPFLYRGAFFAFPLLVCALLVGLRQRQPQLLLFALPAFGMVMFYGLFSHFIGRYGLPMYPVAVAAFVAAATGWWRVRRPALP